MDVSQEDAYVLVHSLEDLIECLEEADRQRPDSLVAFPLLGYRCNSFKPKQCIKVLKRIQDKLQKAYLTK